ncbi:MAG: RidA family protein [Actinomycetia bacterium]|nr:RidA family protein [Actinomycetes bacterium]
MTAPSSTPEQRLAELGLELPAPFPPAADYVPCRTAGGVMYVSGHGPMRDGKAVYTGKVGAELDIATGTASAELTMLNVLASMKADLGELSRVTGFLRLAVFINAAPDFQLHHLVADGASKLLTALWGPGAAHARFAVGMTSLPFSIATEIEAVALVR